MSEKIHLLEEKHWPAVLNEIPDPPKELWVEGELPDQDKYTYLTVVGSRKISQYGRDVCEKLIKGLAGYPIVIVSGLALGTDTEAHKQAIKAGLKTVAIPGSGLGRDVIYPQSNRRLADDIVSAGGALLSEYTADTKPALHTFPRRNRIMAGISRATLIIEAGEKSGTLITYKLALDYNRDILAVPGSIMSPNSWGPNWLISRGATAITKSEDILTALGFEIKESAETLASRLADLTPEERQVIELLSVEALPRDELLHQLNIDPAVANPLLVMLEIRGLIKETMGEVRLA